MGQPPRFGVQSCTQRHQARAEEAPEELGTVPKLGSVWHFDRAVVRVLRLAAHAQGADVATYPSLVCRERRPARSLRDDGETEKT